jgi:hypothetical protein
MSIVQNIVMLHVLMLDVDSSECHYAKCHCAERRCVPSVQTCRTAHAQEIMSFVGYNLEKKGSHKEIKMSLKTNRSQVSLIR